MLSSLLHQAQNQIEENRKNMKFTDSDEESSQFSRFHDYLGLINLVQPTLLSPLDSPSEGSVNSCFEYQNVQLNSRRRMDSYDSDSISDSSSTGGRSSDEIFYDNVSESTNNNFVRKTSPLPLLPDATTISYAQRLESLLVKQSALNHLHATMASKTAVKNTNKASVCVFCRNNGESREFYSSHTLKDNEGNTTCPILRAYVCPLCKASGDQSHTIKYCPIYTPKVRTDKLLGLTV